MVEQITQPASEKRRGVKSNRLGVNVTGDLQAINRTICRREIHAGIRPASMCWIRKLSLHKFMKNRMLPAVRENVARGKLDGGTVFSSEPGGEPVVSERRNTVHRTLTICDDTRSHHFHSNGFWILVARESVRP